MCLVTPGVLCLYYNFQVFVFKGFLSVPTIGLWLLEPLLGSFLCWSVFSDFDVILLSHIIKFCFSIKKSNEWMNTNLIPRVNVKQLNCHSDLFEEKK